MEINAQAAWRSVDFISDLHLQASEMETFEAWRYYLKHTSADAVFILGDLFEVWVGDDSLQVQSSFEQLCVQTLKAASERIEVFFLHGNRDFLLGDAFAQAAGAKAMEDPTILNFAQHRWLLSHGDALCLDDTAYQEFRQQVRSSSWQTNFLALPLAQRQHLAKGMRQQSEQHKQDAVKNQLPFADLDFNAADQLLVAHNANTMVHGHTHKPDHHQLQSGRSRWVLSDWDATAKPARSQVLRVSLPQHHGAQAVEPLRMDFTRA